jgi:hypothetical protein
MNMTTLINLTPHNITIIGPSDIVIPSVGIARVRTASEPVGSLYVCGQHVLVVGSKAERVVTDGILSKDGEWVRQTEECTLPETAQSHSGQVVYIVSSVVASHNSIRGRMDVLVPGDLVRDDAGNVIGCRTLTRIL